MTIDHTTETATQLTSHIDPTSPYASLVVPQADPVEDAPDAQSTPRPTHAINRVIVSGLVQPSPTSGTGFNDLGAQVTNLDLQVLTAYGEAFALPISLAGALAHLYELRKRISRRVVIEGQVHLAVQRDLRYASEENVHGDRVHKMELTPRLIRPLGEDDPLGVTAVELEGVVRGVAVRRRHTHVASLEYGEVDLRCDVEHVVELGGIRTTTVLPYRVRVAVPLDTKNATLLYHPGNRVRVRGVLDCVLIRQLRETAAQSVMLQQLQGNLDSARERFGTNARRLGKEQQKFIRGKRRFELTPKWHVLVSAIEGVGGARGGGLDEWPRWPQHAGNGNGGSPQAPVEETTAENAAETTVEPTAPAEATPVEILRPRRPQRTRRSSGALAERAVGAPEGGEEAQAASGAEPPSEQTTETSEGGEQAEEDQAAASAPGDMPEGGAAGEEGFFAG